MALDLRWEDAALWIANGLEIDIFYCVLLGIIESKASSTAHLSLDSIAAVEFRKM